MSHTKTVLDTEGVSNLADAVDLARETANILYWKAVNLQPGCVYDNRTVQITDAVNIGKLAETVKALNEAYALIHKVRIHCEWCDMPD